MLGDLLLSGPIGFKFSLSPTVVSSSFTHSSSTLSAFWEDLYVRLCIRLWLQENRKLRHHIRWVMDSRFNTYSWNGDIRIYEDIYVLDTYLTSRCIFHRAFLPIRSIWLTGVPCSSAVSMGTATLLLLPPLLFALVLVVGSDSSSFSCSLMNASRNWGFRFIFLVLNSPHSVLSQPVLYYTSTVNLSV